MGNEAVGHHDDAWVQKMGLLTRLHEHKGGPGAPRIGARQQGPAAMDGETLFVTFAPELGEVQALGQEQRTGRFDTSEP